jgi:hypothetical protein
MNERNYLVDLGVDGTMVLREIEWGGVELIHLALDRELWWAVMNTVMNFLFPCNTGNFLTS